DRSAAARRYSKPSCLISAAESRSALPCERSMRTWSSAQEPDRSARKRSSVMGMEIEDRYVTSTPEGVSLSVVLAGLGSRGAAYMIDIAIQLLAEGIILI